VRLRCRGAARAAHLLTGDDQVGRARLSGLIGRGHHVEAHVGDRVRAHRVAVGVLRHASERYAVSLSLVACLCTGVQPPRPPEMWPDAKPRAHSRCCGSKYSHMMLLASTVAQAKWAAGRLQYPERRVAGPETRAWNARSSGGSVSPSISSCAAAAARPSPCAAPHVPRFRSWTGRALACRPRMLLAPCVNDLASACASSSRGGLVHLSRYGVAVMLVRNI